MGTINTRRNKLVWFNETIQAFFSQHPKEKMSKSKLIADFALKNNSTERTGEEIINILTKTMMITVKGDDILK